MKPTIKRNHIYQYRATDKVVSKARMEYKPIKAYLYVKSVKDDVAYCRVALVLEQPKGQKLHKNKWLYVPTANLCEPDLFPKYSNNAYKWNKLVQQPIMASALEILNDISPTVANEVQATMVTAAVTKRDLKVGQNWVDRDGKNKMTLTKQWDKYFIVVDKYGNREKLEPEQLLEVFNKGKYKLLKEFDEKSLLKSVKVLLAPFMGAVGLAALLKLIGGFLSKQK